MESITTWLNALGSGLITRKQVSYMITLNIILFIALILFLVSDTENHKTKTANLFNESNDFVIASLYHQLEVQ